ncbi:MAG: Hpt domain-containing protein [Tropicimonas sp.]|uniref:Hpt domain-containing protein n=1 Tax=Tropicimonas sp. TaxID=2067044 RepID=UPI003A8908E3
MIDWKRVCELRAEVGEADFAEVVDLFTEEVETLIHRLRTQPDPALLREDLHFLKGCAVNLGFSALAELCFAGEILAASGAPEQVDLTAVLDCYQKSRAAFLNGLLKGSAA